ncbi:MAG: hypothetical protein AUH05_17680 [Ktedonobacter sp. 13_2_20CM_53_11]|nr:MAG: hypothetical protein AUH05_17680 [Ktedonobacter sp. 13_2_20CM_53_11]
MPGRGAGGALGGGAGAHGRRARLARGQQGQAGKNLPWPRELACLGGGAGAHGRRARLARGQQGQAERNLPWPRELACLGGGAGRASAARGRMPRPRASPAPGPGKICPAWRAQQGLPGASAARARAKSPPQRPPDANTFPALSFARGLSMIPGEGWRCWIGGIESPGPRGGEPARIAARAPPSSPPQGSPSANTFPAPPFVRRLSMMY